MTVSLFCFLSLSFSFFFSLFTVVPLFPLLLVGDTETGPLAGSAHNTTTNTKQRKGYTNGEEKQKKAIEREIGETMGKHSHQRQNFFFASFTRTPSPHPCAPMSVCSFNFYIPLVCVLLLVPLSLSGLASVRLSLTLALEPTVHCVRCGGGVVRGYQQKVKPNETKPNQHEGTKQDRGGKGRAVR